MTVSRMELVPGPVTPAAAGAAQAAGIVGATPDGTDPAVSGAWLRVVSPADAPGSATSDSSGPRPGERAGMVGRARFLSHAIAIAAQLRAHAVEAPGGVTWHGPPAPGTDTPPAKLAFHLYDGVTGIAFFLAALDHVRERDDHRDLVLGALAPLRRTLRALVRDPVRAQGIPLQVGGLVGLGAFVYALVRTGWWLGEPALVEEARALTALFTPERIAADGHLCVVDGCAGGVLALLALDEAADGAGSPGPTPLEAASACARHLLERRVSHGGRPRAWPGPGMPPLTGFAHGATGIAYALLRLVARTGDEALRDAALEGLAFERSLFDRGADNWLDLRSGRLLEQRAWCHGAPGAALGRLDVLGAGDAEGCEELAGMLRAARAIPDVSLDHLCCGNLGRADILLRAHQSLGDPGLLDDALGLAERAVRRAEAEGGFALLRPGEAPGLRPSLFNGVSGVGYALLRLAAPDALPCILRME